MKILLTLAFLSLPAAAQACGMHGYGQAHGGGGHAATLIYAVLAALGYFVLQHAGKETVKYIKNTGLALGMILAVTGLFGILCGVASHIKYGMSRCCSSEQISRMELEDSEELGGMSEGPEMEVTTTVKKKSK